ncbi:MAG: hypothetical protein K2X39_04505 [Silvanigrellaceae bacterium]|nr:hypothetical protein [Silvanigrellaceae bacterium]
MFKKIHNVKYALWIFRRLIQKTFVLLVFTLTTSTASSSNVKITTMSGVIQCVYSNQRWSAFENSTEMTDFDTLLYEKLGYEDFEELPNGNFLLCKQNRCSDFLKIYRYLENKTYESAINGICNQNRAASADLALPIIHAGFLKIPSTEDTSEYKILFTITAKGDIIDKCSIVTPKSRTLNFFVNELAKLGIVHNDLDSHPGNILWYNNKPYLNDFDLSDDLSAFSKEDAAFRITLERFCTLGQEMTPENMAKLSDADLRFLELIKKMNFPHGALQICNCRKIYKDPTLFLGESYNCDDYDKLFSTPAIF